MKLFLVAITAATIALLSIVYPGNAQGTIEGTWTARTKNENNRRVERDDVFHFQFERENHHGQMSHDFKLKELEGLPPALYEKESTQYNFKVTRPAGIIAFDGYLSWKRGYGDFVLTPDATFLKGLRDNGFDRPDSDELLVFTVTGIDIKFVEGLTRSDIGRLTTEDLVKAAIFNVSPDYVRAVRRMGYEHIDMEDLVKMRIFSIDEEYIADMKELGYTDLSIEDLVKMKIFNIDEDFIREYRKIRGSRPSIEKLVQMKIFDDSMDDE